MPNVESNIISIEIDPNYVHDNSLEAFRLLKQIESGEVAFNEVSTSEQIMASIAYNKNEWLPETWKNGTEKELLNRLNEGQIKAIKAFRQAQL